MFLTCKYAVEQMLNSGGGSIVCLSSISGLAGQKEQPTYGPAKFVASGITNQARPRHDKVSLQLGDIAASGGDIRARVFGDPGGGDQFIL